MTHLSVVQARTFPADAYRIVSEQCGVLATQYTDAGREWSSVGDSSTRLWTGVTADAFRGALSSRIAIVERREKVLRDVAFIVANYAKDMGGVANVLADLADQAFVSGFVLTADWQLSMSPEQRDSIHAGLIAVMVRQMQDTINRWLTIAAETDEGYSESLQRLLDGLGENVPLYKTIGEPPSSNGYAYGPSGPRPLKNPDDDFPFGSSRGEATFVDRAARLQWQSMLAAAKAARVDLDDANPFYEHYLGASGEPMEFDYEEAYREDTRIRAHVDREIAESLRAAQEFLDRGQEDFHFSSPDRMFTGQPETDNWCKTIGGHQTYSQSHVSVQDGTVTMRMTMHAQDRYNFNSDPGDVANGLPDNVNGRFQALGWAQGFDTHGQLERTITWKVGEQPPGLAAVPETTDEECLGGRTEGGWREDRAQPESGSRWGEPTGNGSLRPPTRER